LSLHILDIFKFAATSQRLTLLMPTCRQVICNHSNAMTSLVFEDEGEIMIIKSEIHSECFISNAYVFKQRLQATIFARASIFGKTTGCST